MEVFGVEMSGDVFIGPSAAGWKRLPVLVARNLPTAGGAGGYRKGYCERDLVARFGTLRLRIARRRWRAFLPSGLRGFQRRAEEVTLLIREAFLRGISTRQVGRVVALVTGEAVSAQ